MLATEPDWRTYLEVGSRACREVHPCPEEGRVRPVASFPGEAYLEGMAEGCLFETSLLAIRQTFVILEDLPPNGGGGKAPGGPEKGGGGPRCWGPKPNPPGGGP